MTDYYLQQFVYICLSMIIAALVLGLYHWLSVLIYKKVAEKKRELAGSILSMKASLGLLERARKNIFEYSKKYAITSQKKGYRGFRKQKTIECLERNVASYRRFLEKSENYYEGKGLVTLLRLKKLERRSAFLQTELADAQTLVEVLKNKDAEK